MHRYALLLAALLLPLSLSAQSYVYWTNTNGGTIGRANMDGSGVNLNFVTGASRPMGVVVNAQHIYWTNFSDGTIGRANLDGTGVNQSFIAGGSAPYGLAIDGQYLYWVNSNDGTIGRANLDGTGVNQSFIAEAGDPMTIMMDGTDSRALAVNSQYIYWANYASSTIGRANLDGTGVNRSFITSVNTPFGLNIDNAYIYWTDIYAGPIGRANLDGTGANNAFAPDATSAFGVAVDGSLIYWTSYTGGAIGRMGLDGSNANASFITGAGTPMSVVTTNSGSLPVELVSFTATLEGTNAMLRWETASETNNSGFDVEHRTGTDAFRRVGFAPGRGTTLETTRYQHAVEHLTPGTHTFRLKQIDFDGAFDYSAEVELTLEADGLALALYGTPARDAIRGSLSVPSSQAASVALYDALGRQVLAQQDVQGAFMLDVSGFASGTYVLRVTAGTQAITKTIVVAR